MGDRDPPLAPPLLRGGTESIDALDLVLKILGGSGIAVQLPDSPDDRYQLVHDYLAEVIQPEFGLSRTPEAMQLKGFTKTPSLSLWQ
jgi:hypothetical protein